MSDDVETYSGIPGLPAGVTLSIYRYRQWGQWLLKATIDDLPVTGDQISLLLASGRGRITFTVPPVLPGTITADAVPVTVDEVNRMAGGESWEDVLFPAAAPLMVVARDE